MKKFIIIGILVTLLASILPVALIGYAAFEVFGGNYDAFKRERIIEILSKETTVYFADGQSQLGSLFGNEHRQYVTLKDLPKTMLDGIVAAEDDSFYKHPGIDLLSTMRAAYRNIVLRKHEGASTITQQTVKNLFGRPVTNLRAKYTEAINAFKLERKFSKEEILEFYLNQFHVTGNGRGIGVAAKYYFDKEASELNLTECAFIAGSVKGPERYNPFTKRTQAAQTKAREEAQRRKNYVLKRMLDTKFITQAEFDKSKEEDVPFRQGRFQFNELSVTELVQRQVGRKEVLASIGAETVEEVGSMGLRITTTLEKPVQLVSEYGVRQNLSRLEMILSGFEKEKPTRFVNIQRPEKYGFYVAKIESVDRTKDTETAVLSMGVPQCEVDTQAVNRVAKITDQAFYRGLPKSKAALLGQLAVGDYILASVRDIAADGKILCDIERRPRIQGGLIVLDKGRVISMVGGYSPHEYNRAVFAKRQPGSTFKTLTYYPALQLGWHALEPLLNVRNVYTWQGQFYYPRPDHKPETLETTLAGAGSKSENLASVWLLARVLDHLTFSQFRELLEHLEIYKEGQSDSDLMASIGRTFNVRLSEDHLRGGVFESVKNDMAQDVSISRDKRLRTVIRSMNYGLGFTAEADRVAAARPAKLPPKEKVMRLHVLRNNLQRWNRVAASARDALGRLKLLVENGGLLAASDRSLLASFRLTGAGNAIAFMSPDAYQPQIVSPLLEPVEIKNSTVEDLVAAVDQNRGLLADENVLLDGVMSLGLIKEIEGQIENKFKNVANASVLEKLFSHDDFRYSVGMMYAQRMVKDMGVESDIQWVPSFPLGANVVTLSELALAYQTLLTGNTYRYFEQGVDNQIILLKRIEDAQGNLLWEGEPKAHQLIDSFYSSSILSILRGTVTAGTARAAGKNVVLRSNNPEEDKILEKAGIRLPIFGKTGTTNDYVNATYVGFLPYPAEQGARQLAPDNAYTIAAYVGYDTNEPMKRRGFTVAGGTGALPAWIQTAVALIREEKFAEKLNWKDLVEKKVTEIPFDYGSDAERMTVPLHSAMVAVNEQEGEGGDDEKSDLNTRIDDNAAGKNLMLKMGLPGRVSDGVFVPRVRVSFFKPPVGDERKMGNTGAVFSSSNLPPAPDMSSSNAVAPASANAAGPSGENLPAAPSAPTPFVQNKLPEDNFDGEEPADLRIEMPPAPPGLGIEAGTTAPAVP